MSGACTPILVGVAYLVSEILQLSKTAKFPLLTMNYSSQSSKNLIDQNRPKKFMQVGINVKCTHANFGGRGFFRFRRYCYFQKRLNFPFGPWTIVYGHQKIQSIGISQKNSCKQGLMSSACTPILLGVVSSVSEIFTTFKNGQISPSDHGLQSMVMVIKKSNQSESAQNFHVSRD